MTKKKLRLSLLVSSSRKKGMKTPISSFSRTSLYACLCAHTHYTFTVTLTHAAKACAHTFRATTPPVSWKDITGSVSLAYQMKRKFILNKVTVALISSQISSNWLWIQKQI